MWGLLPSGYWFSRMTALADSSKKVRKMVARMIRSIRQFEILYSVVIFNRIKMVNHFTLNQISSNVVFHYYDMLKNIVAFILRPWMSDTPKKDIPVCVYDSASFDFCLGHFLTGDLAHLFAFIPRFHYAFCSLIPRRSSGGKGNQFRLNVGKHWLALVPRWLSSLKSAFLRAVRRKTFFSFIPWNVPTWKMSAACITLFSHTRRIAYVSLEH